MKTDAVIGWGFGDEGKGKTVSYLCSVSDNPLVIRFTGGPQAGHHVMVDELNHVFSHFGSGSLQGVPTYWSRFCPVDPMSLITEFELLLRKGVRPVLYIDAACPVITPFDVVSNLRLSAVTGHGTCGVGVGQTLSREENLYSLTFSDLMYPKVGRIKLDLIQDYYSRGCGDTDLSFMPDFHAAVEKIRSSPNIILVRGIPKGANYSKYIFEGSQGLMLDKNYGFFPHVTRANTGCRNIASLGFVPDNVYLVTRAYQTRHGNGPMTNVAVLNTIKPNPYERNDDDGVQGKFRIAPIDGELLCYAKERDVGIRQANRIAVVTCLDLLGPLEDRDVVIATAARSGGTRDLLLSDTPFFNEFERVQWEV